MEKPSRLDRLGDPLPEGASARLGTVRLRCPGRTDAVAFAPDGQRLAFQRTWEMSIQPNRLDRRNEVWIYDLASGRLLHRWASDAFSADGRHLAAAGADSTVLLYAPG